MLQLITRRFVNHLTSMFDAQCGRMVWNGGVCKRRHSNGCRSRPEGCRQHAALRPSESMLCCLGRFVQCRPLLTVSAFHSNDSREYVHTNADCKYFPCPSLRFSCAAPVLQQVGRRWEEDGCWADSDTFPAAPSDQDVRKLQVSCKGTGVVEGTQ